MNELRGCQKYSMGPNFIYFGAQKYGYRPIPSEIETEELLKVYSVHPDIIFTYFSADQSPWDDGKRCDTTKEVVQKGHQQGDLMDQSPWT